MSSPSPSATPSMRKTESTDPHLVVPGARHDHRRAGPHMSQIDFVGAVASAAEEHQRPARRGHGGRGAQPFPSPPLTLRPCWAIMASARSSPLPAPRSTWMPCAMRSAGRISRRRVGRDQRSPAASRRGAAAHGPTHHIVADSRILDAQLAADSGLIQRHPIVPSPALTSSGPPMRTEPGTSIGGIDAAGCGIGHRFGTQTDCHAARSPSPMRTETPPRKPTFRQTSRLVAAPSPIRCAARDAGHDHLADRGVPSAGAGDCTMFVPSRPRKR